MRCVRLCRRAEPEFFKGEFIALGRMLGDLGLQLADFSTQLFDAAGEFQNMGVGRQAGFGERFECLEFLQRQGQAALAGGILNTRAFLLLTGLGNPLVHHGAFLQQQGAVVMKNRRLAHHDRRGDGIGRGQGRRKLDAGGIGDFGQIACRQGEIGEERRLVHVETGEHLGVIQSDQHLSLLHRVSFLHHQAGNDPALTVLHGLAVAAHLQATCARNGAVQRRERGPTAKPAKKIWLWWRYR